MKWRRLTIFSLVLMSSNAFAKPAQLKCKTNEYAVKAHNRSSYYKANGTFVKASKVTAHCRTKSPIEDTWIPRLQEGLPKEWPHKSEKATPWSEAEKLRVLEAIEELPAVLQNAPVKSIYRSVKSKDFPNPASNGGGYIVLYNTAFDENRRLARLLAHEAAHVIFEEMSFKEQSNYALSTDWSVDASKRDLEWVPRKQGYVEEDGPTSRGEDFSNNLEYFLFSPDTLQKTTPKAYEWLSKKYGDKLKLKGETK